MKKLLLIFGLLLIVGPVSAWTIQNSSYTGTVEFYDGGIGTAFINGYPPMSFSWKWVGPCETEENCGRFEVYYFWYKIPLISNNGVVTSPSFPGARLV